MQFFPAYAWNIISWAMYAFFLYMLGYLSLFGPYINFFAMYARDIIGWAMYEFVRYLCLVHH